MNRIPHSRFRPFRRHGRKGVALIIVLAIIVLITALVIGLMVRAGSELRSASNYSAAISTKQLTDTVVSLVQAQINDATTQGASNAWASQPGAIRVFDNAGTLTTIYKLYSAKTMTTNALAGALSEDIPSASSWTNNPVEWTDLNLPSKYVTEGNVTNLAYPILDPRDPTSTSNVVRADYSTFGLSVTNLSGVSTNLEQAAPMPARWMYVLRDGKIVSPSISGTEATCSGASSTNPIVGRIAFWTDDDTCKVNINTAADGYFWDAPHFGGYWPYTNNRTPDEAYRAKFQPASGEYQGYPGHPATTTLTNVLGGLGILSGLQLSSNRINLTPRYSFSGSKSGTVVAGTNITPKVERLYTTVGELIFSATSASGQRVTNTVTRQQLEASRFFLTARSRAPEVNLFGKPRVAIWPINANTNAGYRTVTDKLIAFCSSVNGKAYYFLRSDPISPTADLVLIDSFGVQRNTKVLEYLDSLTSSAIPGFGGNFLTKYGDDQRQILTEMFDYIRIINMQDSTIPDEQKRFAKTGSLLGDKGQVTPIYKANWNTRGFGRIPVVSEASLYFLGVGCNGGPSGTIPVDARQPGAAPAPLGYMSGTAPGTWPPVGPNWIGYTPPANTTAVQAFFFLSFFNPAYGEIGLQSGFSIKVTGLSNVSLSAPAVVPLGIRDGVITLKGRSTGDFWAGRNFGMFDLRSMLVYKKTSADGGGPTDYAWNFERTLGTSNVYTEFPYYGNIVDVPNNAGNMAIVQTGPIIVSIYAGTDTTGSGILIQRYNFTFNGATNLRVPLVAAHTKDSTLSTPPYAAPWLLGSPLVGNADVDPWQIDKKNAWWKEGAVDTGDWGGPYIINTAYDTIVSVVPTGNYADYRLMALFGDTATGVPDTAFTLHPSTSTIARYGIVTGHSRPFPSAVSGNFNPSIGIDNTDGNRWQPLVPATVGSTSPASPAYAGNVVGTPPDWDNAFANENPAPYINKGDEGTIHGISIGNEFPYFYNNQQYVAPGDSFFSPNRQVSSAIMFGSLSTGGKRLPAKPWQTLLFRPGPAGHEGSVSPRDHLFLDLFWMPVAEPYAISEPFSTAGKVNMNYQIVPYTYITRNTAIRSVLMNERIAKVPVNLPDANARYAPNLSDTDGTLRQFREKFAAGNIFKSASEICDIYLVPTGLSWNTDIAAQSAWYSQSGDFARVGDNVRERAYAGIYPRLTTKSNVYTVHYMVQALRNALPPTDQNKWDESRGAIVGEYRGSTTLERFLDPNDPSIPDYATDLTATTTLDNFYNWRVIENAQFAP